MEKSKKQPSSQEHKPVGRPRLTNELLDVNLQVRVTKKLADTCKSLGGANFMRPLLEAATQRAMALKKLAPAHPVEESESIKFIDLTVQCGFPSPAADYAENDLSLNDYFVKNKDATFVIEARGDSMIDAGIYEGDILIIDRSVEPRRGDIVLAYLQGDFTLKKLEFVDGKPELHPQNSSGNYPVIHPGEYDDFSIEGVLVGSGRRYRS